MWKRGTDRDDGIDCDLHSWKILLKPASRSGRFTVDGFSLLSLRCFQKYQEKMSRGQKTDLPRSRFCHDNTLYRYSKDWGSKQFSICREHNQVAALGKHVVIIINQSSFHASIYFFSSNALGLNAACRKLTSSIRYLSTSIIYRRFDESVQMTEAIDKFLTRRMFSTLPSQHCVRAQWRDEGKM